jgi:RNA polymerase sigma-70 factor (ECF subfamily)
VERYNGQRAGGAALAGRSAEAEMDAARPASVSPDASDEELMRALTAGQQEALGPLYSRYGPLVFSLAAQSVDRAAAEEIVQEVFLAVWRKADTFDPARGTFRAWVLQSAHYRIINELRSRGRRPQVEPDPDGLHLGALPAPEPDPPDAVWTAYRRDAVRSAMRSLPPPQRQALGLAFFEDLTHEQVASVLELPLGTAKTRIRAGLQKMRVALAPMVLAAAVASLAVLGVRYRQEAAVADLNARALALMTASDAESLRLAPAAGVPDVSHGHYTTRAGTSLAVLSLSYLPSAPAGQAYQAWVQEGGAWRSLGLTQVDASGHALVIAEGADLAQPPAAIQVTLEPAGGSAAPTGPVVIHWPEE